MNFVRLIYRTLQKIQRVYNEEIQNTTKE